MRFLEHIRRKSKVQSHAPEAQIYSARGGGNKIGYSVGGGPAYPRDLAARLPTSALRLIFSYVCPHADDNSYAAAEESMTEDACMLCDMRDLAHCVLVCRRWKEEAERLL